MSVLAKDPTIKLFGKTISLPLIQAALTPDPPAISDLSASQNSSHRQILLSATAYPGENYAEEVEEDEDKDGSRKVVSPDIQKVRIFHQNPEPAISSDISENSRSCFLERETSVERETSAPTPSTNGEQTETEEKTLQKPDKLLPCPRCNSMKTKFCYYNNYNVHQPRHFCKSCQRYWTAGGTMRNVPVGAGRRKNKNPSVSPYRPLMVSISEGHNLETPNSSNGTVLSFGSSSITGSNSSENGSKTSNQEQMVKKFKPFPPQIQTLSPLQWSPQFQPLPVSFYPVPFWGCSLPSSWVLPSPLPASSMSNSPFMMPKTLRIDDLGDAGKSSINGGKLFQAFQSKGDEQSHVQTSPLLQANPAAFSRSIKFHERS